MRSGEATAESGLQRFPVQIASNEDDLTLSLGGILPGAVGFAFEQHVDALEDESVGRIPKVQNALHAEDVLAFGLQEVAQPGIQLFGIEFPRFLKADTGHGFIVSVVMATVLVDMLRFDPLTRPFQPSREFIESVLSEQGEGAGFQNADPIGGAIGSEDELGQSFAGAQVAAGANGSGRMGKKVGREVFGFVER